MSVTCFSISVSTLLMLFGSTVSTAMPNAYVNFLTSSRNGIFLTIYFSCYIKYSDTFSLFMSKAILANLVKSTFSLTLFIRLFYSY
jgi:hypothetical protein